MCAKNISRKQSMNARPVTADIVEREDIPGGQRITMAMRPGKIQKAILRLPEFIERRFEFDAFGVEIIDMCDGKTTVKQMIREFSRRHNLDAQEGEQAVLKFLQTLISKRAVHMMVKGKDKGKEGKDG